MSPRGKEQNEQTRKETFEKITKGALKVFSKYGFYGTTIKKITEASGLSYGLVYYYFPSKEQVFIYLVEEALRQSQEVFERALGNEGTAWEKLESLAETLLHESFSGDSSLYFYIMLQALSQGDEFPELQSKIAEYSQRLYEMMSPIVMAGQAEDSVAEGDPVALIAAFLSLIQGLALFSRSSENGQSPVTPEVLLNVLKK